MTRINVGIPVEELCDQHLLAEYRELPRAFHVSIVDAPDEFTLGKGHVKWCARYQHSLKYRAVDIYKELRYRGFKPIYDPYEAIDFGHRGLEWTPADEELARPLLQERIRDRLASMKRTPKWTRRERPAWSLPTDRIAEELEFAIQNSHPDCIRSFAATKKALASVHESLKEIKRLLEES